MTGVPTLATVTVALAALAGGACDRTVAGGKADGRAVFSEVCARCHGESGRPTESMRAQLGVADLTGEAFRARATLDGIVAQVRHGSTNKNMPAFVGALDDAQIQAVAAYVLQLAAAR